MRQCERPRTGTPSRRSCTCRNERRTPADCLSLMNWNIGNLLPAAAARFGTKTALVFEDRAFTFRELDRLSSRFAGALQSLGVEAGDPVPPYLPHCRGWVVCYYRRLQRGAGG